MARVSCPYPYATLKGKAPLRGNADLEQYIYHHLLSGLGGTVTLSKCVMVEIKC